MHINKGGVALFAALLFGIVATGCGGGDGGSGSTIIIHPPETQTPHIIVVTPTTVPPTWTNTATPPATATRTSVAARTFTQTRTRTATITGTRQPTRTRTATHRPTNVPTVTRTRTASPSPTGTRTPADGDPRHQVCAVTCYNNSQTEGTELTVEQQDVCARATAFICNRAMTFGQYGQEELTELLRQRGISTIICGAYMNGTSNDETEIRLCAAGATANPRRTHMLNAGGSLALSRGQSKDNVLAKIKLFRELAPGVPVGMHDQLSVYKNASNVLWVRENLDVIIAAAPDFPDGAESVEQAANIGVAQCDELLNLYPGMDVYLQVSFATGPTSQNAMANSTSANSFYERLSSKLANRPAGQPTCALIPYQVADQGQHFSQANPFRAQLGWFEWVGDMILRLKSGYAARYGEATFEP